MRVRAGVRSDVGRVRRHNEDNYLVGRRIWAVADGMGGQAAGDVASSIVIERLQVCDAAGPLCQDDLVAAVGAINQAILRYGSDNDEAEGLGSTVCGLASISLGQEQDHWAIFHVGDSRVYRYADDLLTRETVDHSEVEELIQAGKIDLSQARCHPQRNVLTRSLGQSPPPRPDVLLLPPMAGEVFLICSDGLTSEVSDDQIGQVLNGCPDPDQAADRLLRMALEAGGRDNVTVLVLRIEADDEPGSVETERAEDTIPRPDLVVAA
ncbi:MAG: protein phosphatase 2C domain-containing protein [Propionibacteriaceae bacterium]|jgi:protein phosphatase|nr:protein phosphatase 2C domain-containing protein [Propionibacteriaceae bacterium]